MVSGVDHVGGVRKSKAVEDCRFGLPAEQEEKVDINMIIPYLKSVCASLPECLQ
jgi:hypothetical protein